MTQLTKTYQIHMAQLLDPKVPLVLHHSLTDSCHIVTCHQLVVFKEQFLALWGESHTWCWRRRMGGIVGWRVGMGGRQGLDVSICFVCVLKP